MKRILVGALATAMTLGVITPTTATAAAGPSLSLEEGQVVSGQVDVSIESEGDLSLTIDGNEQHLLDTADSGKVVFAAASYDLAWNYRMFVNDLEVELPKKKAGETGANGASETLESAAFPAGTLVPGQANTVRFVSGLTNADNRPDRVYVEDFKVVLDNGIEYVDSASAGTRINVGYDRVPYEFEYPFTVNVPGNTFVWDTTQVADGEHTLVATDRNGSTSVTVNVDNVNPVGLTLNDGDVVSATTYIGMNGESPLRLEIDGTEVTDFASGVMGGTVSFKANSYEGTSRDYMLYVNDVPVRLPSVDAGAGGAGSTGMATLTSDEFAPGVLKPGNNELRFVPGNNGNGVPDRVYVQDFTVTLADGTTFTDPASAGKQIQVGYDRVPFEFEYPFEIAVADSTPTTNVYAWHTTDVSDGPHTIMLTDAQRSTLITVTVDNNGPEIEFDAVQDGGVYRDKDLNLAATATDVVDGEVAVTLMLNGAAIENGVIVSSEQLGNQENTLVATAVDSSEHTATSTVRFTTQSVHPFQAKNPVPAASAENVGAETTISAMVSDPADQPLSVRFLRAQSLDAMTGSITGRTGSTANGSPLLGAGEQLAELEAISSKDGTASTTHVDNAYPYQLFDVEVPDSVSADRPVNITWTGTVPSGQWAYLSVWNYASNSWADLASERGSGEEITLSASLAQTDTVRNGKVTVAAQNRAPFIADSENGVTTFGWVSDTQYYSAREPETFNAITKWIADNAESERIAYTMHTGDIVDTATSEEQWIHADRALQTLDDAGHPYGVVAGNHDFGGSYALYRKYVGEKRFADGSWYGDTADDNIQHYDYISTPEADFMVIYLTWAAKADQWQWVKDQIAAHPDVNVIIATHEQFSDKGDLVGQGERLMDELILPYPNVHLILSGHKQTSYAWVHRLENDRVALQFQQNYQHVRSDLSGAGGGFMRTLTFDVGQDTVTNKTFSVLDGASNAWPLTGCESLLAAPAAEIEMTTPCIKAENFVREIHLAGMSRAIETDYIGITAFTDELLGTQDRVASGERAQIDVSLAPGTQYEWYVETENADGFRSFSDVWSFTTAQLDDGGNDGDEGDSDGNETAGGGTGNAEGEGDAGEDDGNEGSEGPSHLSPPIADELLKDESKGSISGPMNASAGQNITLQVPESHNGSWVQVWLHSEPTRLGTWQQVQNGTISAVIPEQTTLGAHRLVVQAEDGSLLGWSPVWITAQAEEHAVADSLSETGASAPIGATLLLCLLLLAAGGLLVTAHRRVRSRN